MGCTCNTSIEIKTYLKMYTLFLLEEKPHQCNFCSKRFKGYSTCYVHIRRCHFDNDKKPYQCTECQKGFATKGDFDYHMLSHTGERPHICTHCDKSFKTNWYLTLHKRIHSGERPFSCKTCGKTFRWKTDLKHHNQVHNATNNEKRRKYM